MKISLAAYTSTWATDFETEKGRLDKALAGRDAQVEHIGSTSVPGLDAKPILDLLIGLPSEQDLDSAAFALFGLGYHYIRYYERFMPERRYLIRVEAPADADLPVIVDSEVNKIDQMAYPHTHHLHIVSRDSEFWTRHLLFRNWLRTHDDDRDAYAALKHQLATQDWESGNHYAAAKTDFIRSIEQKAQA